MKYFLKFRYFHSDRKRDALIVAATDQTEVKVDDISGRRELESFTFKVVSPPELAGQTMSSVELFEVDASKFGGIPRIDGKLQKAFSDQGVRATPSVQTRYAYMFYAKTDPNKFADRIRRKEAHGWEIVNKDLLREISEIKEDKESQVFKNLTASLEIFKKQFQQIQISESDIQNDEKNVAVVPQVQPQELQRPPSLFHNAKAKRKFAEFRLPSPTPEQEGKGQAASAGLTINTDTSNQGASDHGASVKSDDNQERPPKRLKPDISEQPSSARVSTPR